MGFREGNKSKEEMMDEWSHVRSLVNEELRNLSNSINVPDDLRKAAFHLILAGGKRIRPFILMLSSAMFGVSYNESLPAAISVELLHNFTLIHDDITDKDEFRRGIPTTHVKYGEEIALVAGDFLFSHLYYYLVNKYLKMGKDSSLIIKIVAALSEATDNICIGQVMDLMPEKYIEDENDYFKMVYYKTAALIEASAYIGGILASCSPSELENLRNFGREIGIAFQIADDILGIFGDPKVTGKPVGNDLRMGKKTLLTLYTQKKLDKNNRSLFLKVFGNRRASEDDVKRVIEIIRELGALDNARSIMRSLKDNALSYLRKLPQNKYREYLEQLSEYIISREL